MPEHWSAADLTRFDSADELEIAARRADGSLRRWTPVWVVAVDGEVYVRTWHRRDTGWYGTVLDTRSARVRVAGAESAATVEEAGDGTPELHAAVDAAYRRKYDRYGAATVDRMVTAEAVATTLRLVPG